MNNDLKALKTSSKKALGPENMDYDILKRVDAGITEVVSNTLNSDLSFDGIAINKSDIADLLSDNADRAYEYYSKLDIVAQFDGLIQDIKNSKGKKISVADPGLNVIIGNSKTGKSLVSRLLTKNLIYSSRVNRAKDEFSYREDKNTNLVISIQENETQNYWTNFVLDAYKNGREDDLKQSPLISKIIKNVMSISELADTLESAFFDYSSFISKMSDIDLLSLSDLLKDRFDLQLINFLILSIDELYSESNKVKEGADSDGEIVKQKIMTNSLISTDSGWLPDIRSLDCANFRFVSNTLVEVESSDRSRLLGRLEFTKDDVVELAKMAVEFLIENNNILGTIVEDKLRKMNSVEDSVPQNLANSLFGDNNHFSLGSQVEELEAKLVEDDHDSSDDTVDSTDTISDDTNLDNDSASDAAKNEFLDTNSFLTLLKSLAIALSQADLKDKTISVSDPLSDKIVNKIRNNLTKDIVTTRNIMHTLDRVRARFNELDRQLFSNIDSICMNGFEEIGVQLKNSMVLRTLSCSTGLSDVSSGNSFSEAMANKTELFTLSSTVEDLSEIENYLMYKLSAITLSEDEYLTELMFELSSELSKKGVLILNVISSIQSLRKLHGATIHEIFLQIAHRAMDMYLNDDHFIISSDRVDDRTLKLNDLLEKNTTTLSDGLDKLNLFLGYCLGCFVPANTDSEHTADSNLNAGTLQSNYNSKSILNPYVILIDSLKDILRVTPDSLSNLGYIYETLTSFGGVTLRSKNNYEHFAINESSNGGPSAALPGGIMPTFAQLISVLNSIAELHNITITVVLNPDTDREDIISTLLEQAMARTRRVFIFGELKENNDYLKATVLSAFTYRSLDRESKTSFLALNKY